MGAAATATVFEGANSNILVVLFLVCGLKDEKVIKKQTYTKTEKCKLYSRAF